MKIEMNVDSSDCRKILLCYTSVLHHGRELLWFVSKEIFCFIFKLVFGFVLLIEQLLKVTVKDVWVMSFQC